MSNEGRHFKVNPVDDDRKEPIEAEEPDGLDVDPMDVELYPLVGDQADPLGDQGDPAAEQATRLINPQQQAQPAAQQYAPGSTQAYQPMPAPRYQDPYQQLPPVQAVPSPSREGYDYYESSARRDEKPYKKAKKRGVGASLVSGLLSFVAVILRLVAILMAALVVASAVVSSGAYRQIIAKFVTVAAGFLPDKLAGIYVCQTPLGGVFRGDLVICAVALFVIDFILTRIAHSLRR